MAEALVIARVAAVQGEVFARSPEGKVRRLKVGDPVREGDVITPGEGGRVELALQDGTTRLVRSGEQLTVDAEVAAEVKPDARDAALLAGNGDIDKVIKAINSGGSLDALLEETAAGEAGGADGGSSFVRLMRISESVDPLNFQFSTADRNSGGEIPPSGNSPTEAAAESGAVGGSAGTIPASTIVAVTSDTVAEGTSLVHTVTLSAAPVTPTIFAFSVAGVTAGAGDFASPVFGAGVTNNGDGTITVAAGVSSFSVTIPTTSDAIYEPTETLTLTVGGVAATGTINDVAPTLTVSIGDATAVNEGTSLQYTVTLSGGTSTSDI
ncbi:MAG: retention module-containing protein, partial [Rhodocyclaceae bacterium]